MRRVTLVACAVVLSFTLGGCTHHHHHQSNVGTRANTLHDKVNVLSTILHRHGPRPHH